MTRDEAINLLDNMLGMVQDNHGSDYDKAIHMAIDALKQPERKTGEWINCNSSEHWKCDQCGCRAGYWFNEENSSSYELDMLEWLSGYCPNCGAKMEGEDDG